MNPLRVLLIEEDRSVREALTHRLRHETTEIAAVIPCPMVADCADLGPADVAIVHGRQLAEFRQRRRDLPVVVISGGPAPADFVGQWVMKPAPMDHLLPALWAAVSAGTPRRLQEGEEVT